ncbi:MAG: FtsX-like permease family protein [Taibaiella sp.]|jgi:lipoprotein-releasing system permease protein
MNPAVKIAWRYFRGKKSAQAINIISWISIGAIAVSSAAMVVLFSVFNGLEGTVRDMYSAFNPEIKVTVAKGKFFNVSEAQKNAISKIAGIEVAAYSLEDMVLLNGNDEQKVGTLKGVDENWFKVCELDSFMIEGTTGWKGNGAYTPAITGLDISMSLGIDIKNAFSGLKIYYPRKGANISEDPVAALNSIVVKPEGTFRIQEEFDGQYVLVPLKAAQYLLDVGDKVSSVEIKCHTNASEARVKNELVNILGKGVVIENRFEQNKTFFMIMRGEKWAVYAILLMVLLIASFNMIGSLSMVVLEKKKDIAILKSMGATSSLVRTIFIAEGGLLALVGGLIGILTGTLLCLGQQHFGWISFPDGFIINAYPVAMQVDDFILVMSTALAVGLLASLYPALKAARQAVYVREE